MFWLGVSGTGLVWGWLMVMLSPWPRQRPFLHWLTLVGFTLIAVALVIWFQNGRAAILFLISLILSFCGHMAWKQKMATDLANKLKEA